MFLKQGESDVALMATRRRSSVALMLLRRSGTALVQRGVASMMANPVSETWLLLLLLLLLLMAP